MDAREYFADTFRGSDIGRHSKDIRAGSIEFGDELACAFRRGALATGENKMARTFPDQPAGKTFAETAEAAGDKVERVGIDAERTRG